MRRQGRGLFAAAAVATAALAVSSATAATGETVRGYGGAQLTLPAGWSKVAPVRGSVDEPRTLLVIGSDGVRGIDSPCQVSSYRVPSDGAAVVVIGWRTSTGGGSFLPLSGMKLRRGTFECFGGRGAVARVTRRDRDFQVNVMVGDRASAETVEAALAAARSFGVASRL